ncbi:hypothetical protein BpHYR1_014389 [Brachionus plicatilis]|uniref:Uncharacterized protein n=1 Tax=Brachionus plicatilis TaxID=10195 RepID=A0A3M7RL75_BRAPC|nr:hypothetical protein BpHYR1_014389 [Brachionus plicatilis]
MVNELPLCDLINGIIGETTQQVAHVLLPSDVRLHNKINETVTVLKEIKRKFHMRHPDTRQRLAIKS